MHIPPIIQSVITRTVYNLYCINLKLLLDNKRLIIINIISKNSKLLKNRAVKFDFGIFC